MSDNEKDTVEQKDRRAHRAFVHLIAFLSTIAVIQGASSLHAWGLEPLGKAAIFLPVVLVIAFVVVGTSFVNWLLRDKRRGIEEAREALACTEEVLEEALSEGKDFLIPYLAKEVEEKKARYLESLKASKERSPFKILRDNVIEIFLVLALCLILKGAYEGFVSLYDWTFQYMGAYGIIIPIIFIVASLTVVFLYIRSTFRRAKEFDEKIERILKSGADLRAWLKSDERKRKINAR